MIIGISGSVGTGKTQIALALGKKLNYNVINLNNIAKEFKIKEIPSLQTFDFNIEKLVSKVNRNIADGIYGKNVILEGHFSHFLNPELVDLMIIINRDLKELKKEFIKRGYNEQKIKDNLEVESFNLCFYEAVEEGFEEGKKVFCFDNNSTIDDIIKNIVKQIK